MKYWHQVEEWSVPKGHDVTFPEVEVIHLPSTNPQGDISNDDEWVHFVGMGDGANH